MFRIFYGFLVVVLSASACYGIESGKWVSEKSENGFQGTLEIQNTCATCDDTWRIPYIGFAKLEPQRDASICEIDDGQVLVKGKTLEVYSQGALGFTIRPAGNSIQVIPNLTVDELMCWRAGLPEWVRTFKGARDMEKEISELKWHKVQ